VGVLASLIQATTQIQESTLSSVPKLLAALGALVLAGPWIGAHLARFTQDLFAVLPSL
jgi:flagellar biosynthesis protein FliQ